MPDLLKLKTADWDLTVWCSDLQQHRKTYLNTLTKRSAASDAALIRFSPPLSAEHCEALSADSLTEVPATDNLDSLQLPEPVFFENMQYQFEWTFSAPAVTSAEIQHRLETVNRSFRFVCAPTADGPGARLTGTINTGNDVGWFRLPLCYLKNTIPVFCSVSFEVLPVKMSLQQDLPVMRAPIEQHYPLWLFSLARKTEQGAGRGRERGNFALLWLEQFSVLRDNFEKGLKVIAAAPHSRLQPVAGRIRADRIKGKISARMAERISADLNNGDYDKRYRTEKKRLSVDTPENRFIKMIVDVSKRRLAELNQKLILINRDPENQRLSEAFLDEIAGWQKPLLVMQKQSFLREVGPFSGLNGESLVLQQKTGYSAVYRIWQDLKYYLELFDGQASVSIKSVAEIYELWCFLTIRNILKDGLGFVETAVGSGKLELQDCEYRLVDGSRGAFQFSRSDGVTARLVHEPVYSRKTKPVRIYPVAQKPDILLDVTFPDGRKYTWLFDAKYRILESTVAGPAFPESIDLVPEDAINQMHRYRDALIHVAQHKSEDGGHKTRPVLGAFALYPGFFDQKKETNPYAEAIAEIGIGAFALLPETGELNGSHWLKEFLTDQIGLPVSPYAAGCTAENLFVRESARIPHYGMQQILYPDLVMTVALGSGSGKKKSYLEAFREGTAKWYHIPVSTFNSRFRHHIVDEIRYLALAESDPEIPGTRIIRRLWPVVSTVRVRRNKLTTEQAGSEKSSEEMYVLFGLGKPLQIRDSVGGVPLRNFRSSMKLTRLNLIEGANDFSELKTVYPEGLSPVM